MLFSSFHGFHPGLVILKGTPWIPVVLVKAWEGYSSLGWKTILYVIILLNQPAESNGLRLRFFLVHASYVDSTKKGSSEIICLVLGALLAKPWFWEIGISLPSFVHFSGKYLFGTKTTEIAKRCWNCENMKPIHCETWWNSIDGFWWNKAGWWQLKYFLFSALPRGNDPIWLIFFCVKPSIRRLKLHH